MPTSAKLQATYGVSTLWPGDRPLIKTPVADPFIIVGQRVRNRLSTPRGGLAVIGGDPNFGWDVRRYVLKKVSGGSLAEAQEHVRLEVLKDEAIQSAIVTFNYVNNGPLTIKVDCMLAIGPLQLVLTVTALTVTAAYNYQ